VLLLVGALVQVLSLHVTFHTQGLPEEFLEHAASIVATVHAPLVTHPVPVVIQFDMNPEQAVFVVIVLGALEQILSTHAVPFQ